MMFSVPNRTDAAVQAEDGVVGRLQLWVLAVHSSRYASAIRCPSLSSRSVIMALLGPGKMHALLEPTVHQEKQILANMLASCHKHF